MQSTLGFAPTGRDLDEGYFDLPIITTVPAPPPEPPRASAPAPRLTPPPGPSRLSR